MPRRNLKQEFHGGWTSMRELSEALGGGRGKSVSTLRRRLKALEAEHGVKLIRQTAGGGKWEVHLGELEKAAPELFRHRTTKLQRRIAKLQGGLNRVVEKKETESQQVTERMLQHRNDLKELIDQAEKRINVRLGAFEKSVRDELSALSNKVKELEGLIATSEERNAGHNASNSVKTSTGSERAGIDDVHG